MSFDIYSMEQMVKLRLEEARRHAAHEALIERAAPARPLRLRVGLALIRAGRRLAGPAPRAPRLA